MEAKELLNSALDAMGGKEGTDSFIMPSGPPGEERLRVLKLARRKIEKALDLAPDLYLGHEFYGIYFNMLGEPEEALQHHRESIRLNEDDGWPYADYANSLRAVSRYQEAIHALGEALKIEPTNPIFHRNLGLMFHDQGEIVEAEEHYSAPRYHAERHRKTLLFPSTDTYESPPKLAC